MVSPICKGRLMKEYKSIQGNPPENIVATPLENNILECHYVIRGVAGPYKGGYYWGKLYVATFAKHMLVDSSDPYRMSS